MDAGSELLVRQGVREHFLGSAISVGAVELDHYRRATGVVVVTQWQPHMDSKIDADLAKDFGDSLLRARWHREGNANVQIHVDVAIVRLGRQRGGHHDSGYPTSSHHFRIPFTYTCVSAGKSERRMQAPGHQKLTARFWCN